MKRSLSDALIDLVCGLVAYATARAIWEGRGGVWENLPKELATFVGAFAVLRLLLAAVRRSWRRRRESRRIAQAVRRQGP